MRCQNKNSTNTRRALALPVPLPLPLAVALSLTHTECKHCSLAPVTRQYNNKFTPTHTHTHTNTETHFVWCFRLATNCRKSRMPSIDCGLRLCLCWCCCFCWCCSPRAKECVCLVSNRNCRALDTDAPAPAPATNSLVTRCTKEALPQVPLCQVLRSRFNNSYCSPLSLYILKYIWSIPYINIKQS